MASRGGELMQKNKQKLNRANEKQQNYRLYKAKKQWITACTTVFLTFGASVVVTTSVQADEVVAIQRQLKLLVAVRPQLLAQQLMTSMLRQ